MTSFNPYRIFYRHFDSVDWTPTEHIVRARTQKEAQSKAKKKMDSYRLTSMSILAILDRDGTNTEIDINPRLDFTIHLLRQQYATIHFNSSM